MERSSHNLTPFVNYFIRDTEGTCPPQLRPHEETNHLVQRGSWRRQSTTSPPPPPPPPPPPLPSPINLTSLCAFSELKERHMAATETVNSLRERLKQKRLLLLDTDVAGYARAQGKSPVTFGPTDLVCCRTLQGHTGKECLKALGLAWFLKGIKEREKNRIVSASQDGRLIVWNALTSQKTHAIKLPCAWVMTCAFSPSGQSVACGGLDSVCSIFNLNSPTDKDGNLAISKMLSGHKGYVSSCQYVPDEDTHLITSSGDQTCVLWDITTGLRTSVFGGEFQSGHTADVLRLPYGGNLDLYIAML
ncbi:Guanine nucleotide-binding protein subunit beta-1 [Vitis vinifera]|uniref:Guanine nucleotide-binding protein subunit beta-1 n=1 Tax=Vitis vinifera TaxID=29760 RepID=A0A438C0V2_VITVI|nr:Guanine nucleotide-binding protein subunit beta-1 [Vitis vinifera]